MEINEKLFRKVFAHNNKLQDVRITEENGVRILVGIDKDNQEKRFKFEEEVAKTKKLWGVAFDFTFEPIEGENDLYNKYSKYFNDNDIDRVMEYAMDCCQFNRYSIKEINGLPKIVVEIMALSDFEHYWDEFGVDSDEDNYYIDIITLVKSYEKRCL